MNRPSEPLNAEERDLAKRLARTGGAREPAPALDARILAMARAASAAAADDGEGVKLPAATQPETPAPATGAPDPKIVPLRRRTPLQRWPMGLGLAASLVLAAGLGWKLHIASRDVTERPMAAAVPAADAGADGFEVGPPLPRDASAAATNSADAAVVADQPAADAAVAPASPARAASAAAEDADLRRERSAQASMEAADAMASSSADRMAPEPVVVPEPAMAPAPPPPPPPAPAAPAAKVVVDDSGSGNLEIDAARTPRSDVGGSRSGGAEFTRTPLDQRRQQISANRSASEAPPSPPATVVSPAERARMSAGTTRSGATEGDKPVLSGGLYDERPPVSADSTEFRQAWLQRIRALLAKGDTAAATDSLKEFRRRYPDAELPDDLRKLLPAQPSNP